LSNLIPQSLLFSDFEKGDETIDIPFESFSIRPLICLEGIYGKFYNTPPNGIVAILANNAWYDNSTAGSKFLKFAQVHAAEFQTMVVVSANTGQSAIISPSGALIQSANHQNSDILSHTIQTKSRPSIYHKFPWAGSMVLIMCWIGILWKKLTLGP
jgi:apolipoprotein N-acyltransferase